MTPKFSYSGMGSALRTVTNPAARPVPAKADNVFITSVSPRALDALCHYPSSDQRRNRDTALPAQHLGFDFFDSCAERVDDWRIGRAVKGTPNEMPSAIHLAQESGILIVKDRP